MKSCYPEDVLTYCPSCGSGGFSPVEKSQVPVMHLICSACGFEFFINAAASSIILLEKEPGVLLMTRRLADPAKGTLDLPGGFVDPRERAEDAAARELMEECGLRALNLRLLNHTYWNEYLYGGIVYYTLDLVFTCCADNWDELSADRREVETVLIRREDINPEDVGLISVRKVVSDYVQGRIG